jgi:hypothetical protein
MVEVNAEHGHFTFRPTDQAFQLDLDVRDGAELTDQEGRRVEQSASQRARLQFAKGSNPITLRFASTAR